MDFRPENDLPTNVKIVIVSFGLHATLDVGHLIQSRCVYKLSLFWQWECATAGKGYLKSDKFY